MGTFIALVVAIIAFALAKKARDEVRELRVWIAWQQKQNPQVWTTPQPEGGAGAPPAVPPAPRRPAPEPQPEPVIPIYQPPAPEPVAAFEAP